MAFFTDALNKLPSTLKNWDWASDAAKVMDNGGSWASAGYGSLLGAGIGGAAGAAKGTMDDNSSFLGSTLGGMALGAGVGAVGGSFGSAMADDFSVMKDAWKANSRSVKAGNMKTWDAVKDSMSSSWDYNKGYGGAAGTGARYAGLGAIGVAGAAAGADAANPWGLGWGD